MEKYLSMEDEFDAEQIRKIALDEVERTLCFKKYDPEENEKVCLQVSKNVLNRLSPQDSEGKSNFKYVTHCFISPRETSGYDVYSNNLWSENTDGMCVVDYENTDVRFCITIWGVRS